jgi:hypothetical protein
MDAESELDFRQSSFQIGNFSQITLPVPALPDHLPVALPSQIFKIELNPVEETGFVERIDSVILNRLEIKINYTPAMPAGLKMKLRLGAGNYYHVDAGGRKTADVEYVETGGGYLQTISYDNILIKPEIDSENNHIMPIEVSFQTTGEPLEGGMFDVKYSITALDMRVAYGVYPAATLVEHSGTLSMGDLSFLKGFNFYNPEVSFDVTSNFGAYFKVAIDSVAAYNSQTPWNKQYMLFKNGGSTADSKSDLIAFDKRALRPGESVFFPNIKTYSREDGRVDLLLQSAGELMPDRIDYNLALLSYLKEDNHAEPFFVIPEAKAKVGMHVKIPLHFGEGSNMVYRDSIYYGSLSSLPPISDITLNEAMLRLTIRNGLPVRSKFLIKDFIDSLGNIIPNTFTQDELTLSIPSPAINAGGTVNTGTAITPYIYDLHLNDAKYETVRRAQKISIEVILDQENGRQICFQPSNNFEVKLGVYADIDGLTTKNVGLNLDSLINGN